MTVFLGIFLMNLFAGLGIIDPATCTPGLSPDPVVLENGDLVYENGHYCYLPPPQPTRQRSR